MEQALQRIDRILLDFVQHNPNTEVAVTIHVLEDMADKIAMTYRERGWSVRNQTRMREQGDEFPPIQGRFAVLFRWPYFPEKEPTTSRDDPVASPFCFFDAFCHAQLSTLISRKNALAIARTDQMLGTQWQIPPASRIKTVFGFRDSESMRIAKLIEKKSLRWTFRTFLLSEPTAPALFPEIEEEQVFGEEYVDAGALDRVPLTVHRSISEKTMQRCIEQAFRLQSRNLFVALIPQERAVSFTVCKSGIVHSPPFSMYEEQVLRSMIASYFECMQSSLNGQTVAKSRFDIRELSGESLSRIVYRLKVLGLSPILNMVWNEGDDVPTPNFLDLNVVHFVSNRIPWLRLDPDEQRYTTTEQGRVDLEYAMGNISEYYREARQHFSSNPSSISFRVNVSEIYVRSYAAAFLEMQFQDLIGIPVDNGIDAPFIQFIRVGEILPAQTLQDGIRMCRFPSIFPLFGYEEALSTPAFIPEESPPAY